ncbi:MAG: FAD-binding protein, partial [Thermoleophilia bacterium]
MNLHIRRDVPLAPFTTLELGGPARYFLEAPNEETLVAGIRWALRHDAPVHLLGAGSNLVVGDEGVEGLVIRLTSP